MVCFFQVIKEKNGSLRQTLHPFKQTTGKESISRFPPTCAASARDPKLALDFVLDDARVFLCGDLAVVRPCSAGRRSPRVRHLWDLRVERKGHPPIRVMGGETLTEASFIEKPLTFSIFFLLFGGFPKFHLRSRRPPIFAV